MTVWIHELREGEYEEVATVENGSVVSGSEELVTSAFPDGIPGDEEVVARAFNSPAMVASTDFEVEDWQPEPSWAGESQELGGTGNRCLSGIEDSHVSSAPEWDRPLLEMQREVSDPESDTSRTLVSYAESATPEFVLERIREAIMSGSLFSEFEEIPSDKLMDLRETFADSLGSDDFTLDSITEELMEFEADLSRDEAETIARTETHATLTHAREDAYEERGETEARFYWTGATPGSPRQTEFCEYLIEKSNPNYGGDPMPLEELKAEIQRAPEIDDDINTSPREWTPHINCRSTFVKAPGT